MVLYDELYIRTQYDGHDYRSVLQIYYYDENGDEQELEDLTDMCHDISTCADQGEDTWSWLKAEVSERLKGADIKFSDLNFDYDEPSIGANS